MMDSTVSKPKSAPNSCSSNDSRDSGVIRFPANDLKASAIVDRERESALKSLFNTLRFNGDKKLL
jgi:hypothetical protein